MRAKPMLRPPTNSSFVCGAIKAIKRLHSRLWANLKGSMIMRIPMEADHAMDYERARKQKKISDKAKHETHGILIDGERYLTLAEVIDYLPMSEQTIRRRRLAGNFPKPTDEKKYLLSEVTEWYTRRS